MADAFAHSTALRVFAVIAMIFLTAWVFLALFQPHQDYRVKKTVVPLESEEFMRMLETITDARLTRGNKVTVLPNGENFYPEMLKAIESAKHSVNMEAFMFEESQIGKKFVEALAERARAGVQVRVVADAMGSMSTQKGFFKPAMDAGAKVHWYHALRWYNFDRVNNRTHRELLIIDGNKAFIGGPGIADHWYTGKDGKKRWRDTVAMINGPAVAALQGTFVENWVEASGEVLSEPEFYPVLSQPGNSPALVVNSAPTLGGSTRARMLFQTVMSQATSDILITTPYFLPDVSMRKELLDAVKRGVKVQVIVPGKDSDQTLTRRSSRRLYGELLQAGVKIYEYKPSMIHTKSLVVDGKWSILGSTNIDNRSFGLNDECNLAVYDGDMSTQLVEQFYADQKDAQEITYEQWKNRPFWEKFHELFGRLIERQQ